MKIQIEMLDNGVSYLKQMEAVDTYIKQNTVGVDKRNCWYEPIKEKDVVFFEIPAIKPTKKGTSDKIDIESFGFNETSTDEFELEDYELYILPDGIIKIIQNYTIKWHCIFLGTIKIKSELRKVLKMLDICYA